MLLPWWTYLLKVWATIYPIFSNFDSFNLYIAKTCDTYPLLNFIKMISAQHSSNNGKNWQKLSYQKILWAR